MISSRYGLTTGLLGYGAGYLLGYLVGCNTCSDYLKYQESRNYHTFKDYDSYKKYVSKYLEEKEKK